LNLLRQYTKVCFSHWRHEELKDFFLKEVAVEFCSDICPVMEVLVHEYNPHQWRLFIDPLNVSLKVVLHHNGNRYPSDPLAHAANVKASFESIWEVYVRRI